MKVIRTGLPHDRDVGGGRLQYNLVDHMPTFLKATGPKVNEPLIQVQVYEYGLHSLRVTTIQYSTNLRHTEAISRAHTCHSIPPQMQGTPCETQSHTALAENLGFGKSEVRSVPEIHIYNTVLLGALLSLSPGKSLLRDPQYEFRVQWRLEFPLKLAVYARQGGNIVKEPRMRGRTQLTYSRERVWLHSRAY